MATGAPPPPPSSEVVDRYRSVIVAGHNGDEQFAAAHLDDAEPMVREAALSAMQRMNRCTAALLRTAFDDASPQVRGRAAELAAHVDGVTPAALLDDADARVVEVACFACGEMIWGNDDAPVEVLSRIAQSHDDALCRESAAAALGAIGDPSGLDAVLVACSDRVTVRRRATLALAAFDDPRADAALHAALDDKDWQVRQAAEDLLEVNRKLEGEPDPDAYA